MSKKSLTFKGEILTKRKKILVFLIAACCVFPISVFAIDFTLAPSAFAIFPAGSGNEAEDGSARYNIGGGGALQFEFDIASVLPNPLGIGYTIGIEGGILHTPFQYGSGGLNAYFGGGGLGLYYYPISRLLVRVDGGIGVYSANDGDDKTAANLWFRAGGELGFRFTPALTITANAGWRQFQGDSRPLNSGVYAGLGVRLTFELGSKSEGGAGATLYQDDAVYPVLTPLYLEFPIGTVDIRNNENAEIRNVKLFFRAGAYTASEYPCGEASIIPKGRSVELPLYADFSPEVLRFADSGRILGEIVIRYNFLGREREAVRTVSVAVHNRNTVVPGDNAALAAFISPTSPEVLQFSKYLTALARTKHRMGLNLSMEFAMWIFEGMKVAGIRTNASSGSDAEVQFPSQTLAYGSGSARDAALLFVAALEAAGIRSAMVILPNGEIISAVNLGIGPDDAVTAALFNGPDKLLITDNDVWLPVAMSRLGDGFSAAWQEAIERIDGLISSGQSAEMIIIQEAWESYPPVAFPALGTRLILPDSDTVNTSSDAVVQSYIRSEFTPKISALQEQIRRSPSASLYNQMGNLYMRSGQISQAKSA